MAGSDLRGLRLLIVEDESLVSMLIEDMLAEIGCMVVGIAARLDEALAKASTLAFDAAIAGQGVLLAVDRMSEDLVATGHLVRPFATLAETTFDYWFIVSTVRRLPKKVTVFRDWLWAELGLSRAPAR